ncbi:Y-family DNA polymerase [Vibrio chagasii]|uniref:Y-family DNA polymerase n=2 Tax=Vibrio chagasii TaxID=170679 RepID=A0A7V7NX84_9VIBR|nr:Y-family DNA polymerase [Vibrio chagasii]
MYVSCECVFQPQYRKKPCVVLSNNDGAVVAANRLAVEAGIAKFEPYFKQKGIIDKNGIKVFSSNYALYASISGQMMATISEFASESHIYSIDEIFLNLTNDLKLIPDVVQFGQKIRQTVWRECRIPVSFGSGPTLTLSKLANKLTKSIREYNGVCVIKTEKDRIDALKMTSVKDVWGIGRASAKRLKWMGIDTAFDLALLGPEEARRRFDINMQRTVLELQGEPAKMWDDCRKDKQQIMSTRSVGTRIRTLDELKQALSFHASIVARKCRDQNSSCLTLMAFANTSPFDNKPQSFKAIHQFEFPSSDSTRFSKVVTGMAESLFKSNVDYYKVGVGALQLVSDKQRQVDLFAEPEDPALMGVVDNLNAKFGRGAVFLGAQGTRQEWSMRREFLSPSFTTRLSDLPVIQC